MYFFNPHTEKADVPLLAQLQIKYIARSCKAFFRELAMFASSLFRMSIQSLIQVQNFLEYSSCCSSLARISLIWPFFFFS